MPNSLLIVESPAKCDKIEKYLGVGYKCLASFGHLRQLPGLKNIDLNANFSPTFEIISSKNKQKMSAQEQKLKFSSFFFGRIKGIKNDFCLALRNLYLPLQF